MRSLSRGFAVLALTVLLVACGTAAAEPEVVRSNGTTSTTVDWSAVIRRQENERIYWAEVVAQQRRAADARWRARVEAYFAALRRAEAARRATATPSGYRSGQCGGSLPPCYVMMRESRGNIHAQNPRSTASGKWQFLDSTWGRHRGYAKARYAPEWVQDERARQLWNGGRGCGHWDACGR